MSSLGSVQVLRVSVQERMSAAAEDFLSLLVEKGKETTEIPELRALLTERLAAAAQEIFGLIEKTVAEYEDKIKQSEQEVSRQRKLLDAVLKPDVNPHRDVQGLLVSEEEVLLEQQPYYTQEGEQFQGLEEADLAEFPSTYAPVKSKTEADERKPQSSHLHQRKIKKEAKPLASSSTECMTTERDGDDGGCSEQAPASNLQPTGDGNTSECEPEMHDSDDDDDLIVTSETGLVESGLDSLKILVKNSSQELSCSVCGKTFGKEANLKKHLRVHTGEKPFTCSVCGNSFRLRENLNRHRRSHTGEKPFNCSVCSKSFGNKVSLKRHKISCHTSQII